MTQLQETLTDGTIDLKVESLRHLPEGMPPEAYLLTAYSFPTFAGKLYARGFVHVMWMGVAPAATMSAKGLLEQGMAVGGKTLDARFVNNPNDINNAMKEIVAKYQKLQLKIEDEHNSIAFLIPTYLKFVDNRFSDGVVHKGLGKDYDIGTIESLAMNLYRDTFGQRNLDNIKNMLPDAVSEVQKKRYGGLWPTHLKRRLVGINTMTYFGVPGHIVKAIGSLSPGHNKEIAYLKS